MDKRTEIFDDSRQEIIDSALLRNISGGGDGGEFVDACGPSGDPDVGADWCGFM